MTTHQFHFQDASQLAGVEAFEAHPAQGADQVEYWTVIGTLKGQQIPIADLPTERYAALFVELCEQLTGKAK